MSKEITVYQHLLTSDGECSVTTLTATVTNGGQLELSKHAMYDSIDINEIDVVEITSDEDFIMYSYSDDPKKFFDDILETIADELASLESQKSRCVSLYNYIKATEQEYSGKPMTDDKHYVKKQHTDDKETVVTVNNGVKTMRINLSNTGEKNVILHALVDMACVVDSNDATEEHSLSDVFLDIINTVFTNSDDTLELSGVYAGSLKYSIELFERNAGLLGVKRDSEELAIAKKIIEDIKKAEKKAGLQNQQEDRKAE